MNPLLKEVRHNPMLWLLAFVPVVFAAAKLEPEAHTLLFVLSVLAIVPLAVLLSHATESVAAKTGDAAGGLLNATLGNLTELVIALTALRAGQYMLVKASIAGGHVRIKFTDTRGGTELGVPIDRSRSDLRAIESDNGSAEIRVVGDLTLDYVKVTCVARIDLATLQGEGHLEVR